MQKGVILYKGIGRSSGETTKMIKEIKKNGLYQYTRRHSHPKWGEDVVVIFCTSDIMTAKFYAIKWAKTTEGIIVVFKRPINDIVVDGRDSLINILEHYPLHNERLGDKLERYLLKIYGEKVLWYVHKVMDSAQHDERLRLAFDATMDPEIIRLHIKNRMVFRGRSGVILRNSFATPEPIEPNEIIGIEKVSEYHEPEPEIVLF